jgi:hypothetical protein
MQTAGHIAESIKRKSVLYWLEETSLWRAQSFQKGYRVRVLSKLGSEPRTRAAVFRPAAAQAAPGLTLSVRLPCSH